MRARIFPSLREKKEIGFKIHTSNGRSFRLVAATKPAEYKTMKHKMRVYIAIAITWVFSIGLSLPLGMFSTELTDSEPRIRLEHEDEAIPSRGASLRYL